MTHDLGPAGTGAANSGPAQGTAIETRTFLIADIRGYTIYTREKGDEAAAALAARFAAIVGEVVAGREGFLVEIRGDEALAVFSTARQALRAALELQDRFRAEELPRGVGIGLDSGEAIPLDGGYRGTALNLAARLCGEAGPGEILASEAVIHLAATVDGIGYADPRVYHLKGIEQPIRAVHVVPADKGAKGPIRYGGEGGVDRRIVAVGGIAALAIVIATIGLSGALDPSGPTPAPSGQTSPSAAASTEPFTDADLPLVAWVDPSSGAVGDRIPIDTALSSGEFVDGSYWMKRADPYGVIRFDQATHEAVQTVAIPLAAPGAIDIDARTIWVSDLTRPRVIGIDIGTGVPTLEFDDLASEEGGRPPATSVAVAAGSIWVGLPDAEELVRIDPVTGAVKGRIDVPRPDRLAWDGEALYATGGGQLHRIDPATNTVAWSTQLADFANVDQSGRTLIPLLPTIQFGGDSIWTVNPESGTVWKVRPSGVVADEYQVGVGALPMAPSGDTMWVAVQDAGTLTGIDMITGAAREIGLGHFVTGVVAGNDELLVAIDRTPEETVAQVEGDVLTIATPFSPFFGPNPDPATNGSFEFRQAGFITCAGLLRYPDTPGPGAWDLEPEVATALPVISADGRTYTFTIREGFAFSPPSGEPITAETFRSTLERALSPALDSIAGGTLDAIEGVIPFRDGAANHVSGIVVDGDRLVITLTAPTGDFLNRLTLPYFCPVPIGTPAVRNLDPSPPLPAAGPYFHARHVGGELGLFLKNPNYHGPRPQPFDGIAFRFGFGPGDAIARVDSGLSDAAVSGAFEPLLNAQSKLAERWGPASEAASAGDQRWFGGPRLGNIYLSLDPADPLLADVEVRRAISLAVDRARLAAVRGLAPAAGLLPPSIQGAPGVDVSVPAPDPDAARALLAGRTGTLTFPVPETESDDPLMAPLGGELARQLAPIGITVELTPFADLWGAWLGQEAGIDIMYGFTDTDHPDPVAQFEDVSDWVRLSETDLAELDRLWAVSGPARYEAAATLASRITDTDYLAVPIGYPVYPLYLGEDIGCGSVQPAIGAVDLLSLCREP
jgi:peptide/nickel transport system substrate-binding protein